MNTQEIDIFLSELDKALEEFFTPSRNLRYYRFHNKLSRWDVAKNVGVKGSDIKKMETGKLEISEKVAIKLAYFFEVLPKAFLSKK